MKYPTGSQRSYTQYSILDTGYFFGYSPSPMFQTRFIAGGSMVLAFALMGCGTPPPQLKPEEVLRRTVIADRMLDSVAISATGSMKLISGVQTSSITLSATGVIHAGSVWSLGCRAIMNRIGSTGNSNDIGVTLSSPGGGLTFLRLESVSGQDLTAIQEIFSGSTVGQWWLLSGDPSKPRSTAVTTPALDDIGTFLSAFTILKDEGWTNIDGRNLYHFTVAARPELSSQQLTGEVWIDAETFFLVRAVWEIKNVPSSIGLISGNVTLFLRDQNHAPDAIMATASGAKFPLKRFLGIVL